MEKKIVNGGYPLAPLPVVLVSCGSVEKPLVLTVSWTGIICSNPLKVYISVQPSRNSSPVIKETGEFVINIPGKNMRHVADFCGTNSGRDVDKFAHCSITAAVCEYISAPMIEQCPVSIECKVSEVLHLGSHDMFIADVLATHIDPQMTSDGKFDFAAVDPIAYANSSYYDFGSFGEKMGYTKKL